MAEEVIILDNLFDKVKDKQGQVSLLSENEWE